MYRLYQIYFDDFESILPRPSLDDIKGVAKSIKEAPSAEELLIKIVSYLDMDEEIDPTNCYFVVTKGYEDLEHVIHFPKNY